MAVGETKTGTLTANTVETVTLEGNVHYAEITHDGNDPEPIYAHVQAADAAGDVADPTVGGEDAHVIDDGDSLRVVVHSGQVDFTRDRGNIIATSGTNPGQAIVKLISAGVPSFSVKPTATP